MGADYDKVDAIIKAVVERVKKFSKLPDDKRDDLAFSARALRYNALQAKAADHIKAKEFGKAADVVDADLTAMKAELTAKADPKAKETAAPNLDRMRKAQRGLLIAAMSAYVQDKKADKANELLDLLEKTSGGLESSVAVMQQLADSIRGQIDELGKAGNKAEADGLRRSFGEFLDKIKGDDPAKLSTGVVTFLGSGYAAVDQHAKAAELYQTLVTKAADATQKRRFQFLQARAYREAGDKDSFDKAAALMKEIVGNPLDPNPKAARGWGYNNLNIRKEYNYLQEDQKYFRPAIDNWLRLTREMFSRGLPPQVRKPVLMNQEVVLTMGPVVDHALHQALARAITEAFGTGPQATAIPMPLPSARAWFDFCFRGGLDAQITKRKTERNTYFDLYYEAQRCSAKAFSSQDPAKFKGGQEGINTGLTNIGQRLFDLVSKNDDVSEANLEKIQDLLGKYPVMKTKYDALKAAGPKP
jgi:hypothetical protein